jgi:hypothetical protein
MRGSPPHHCMQGEQAEARPERARKQAEARPERARKQAEARPERARKRLESLRALASL